MSTALEGIRVVEFAAWQQGPEAGAMLGDLGAEVIKVERPPSGDAGRWVRELNSQLMAGADSDVNYYFEIHNRNKKAIAVDVQKDRGREIIWKLVQKSDVFVTNFRLHSLERLRLDYDSLSQVNPRLIYGIGTAYGLKGAESNKEGYDSVAQARSGIMTLVGAEPGHAPRHIGLGNADQLGAIVLAYAIMTALFVRERTGNGQLVSTSILGSLVSLQSHMIQAHLITGQQPRDIPRTENRNPFWNTYRTSDDRWLFMAMPRSEEHWHNFCQILNMKEMEYDPRFDTHDKRMENAKALISIMDQRFVTKPLAEWVKRVEGTGIVLAPVNEYADVACDQQVLANEYILEDIHHTYGRMRVPGSPVYLSKTPAKRQRWAPELGQHTEEVLTEICGYSWDEISALKDEEVIM